MSKQIPQKELNKKFSYRLKQWFLGESDTYVGLLESKPQEECGVDQKVIKSHQRDQEQLLEQVHDTEHNKVYKNFLLFYSGISTNKQIALINVIANLYYCRATIDF